MELGIYKYVMRILKPDNRLYNYITESDNNYIILYTLLGFSLGVDTKFLWNSLRYVIIT